MVQREKKYMAYDLHPVLIPYLVSKNSSKSKIFDKPFLSNCDFRVDNVQIVIFLAHEIIKTTLKCRILFSTKLKKFSLTDALTAQTA